MKALTVSILAFAVACGGGGPETKPPVVGVPSEQQPVVDDPALPFAQRMHIVQGEQLEALIGSVMLTTDHADGLPYRRVAGALTGLEVHAAFPDGTPVHGAPIVLLDAAGAHLGDAAMTNAAGVAHVTVPPGLAPNTGVRVTLDIPAGATGAAVLPVTLRETTLSNARVALKFDVTVSDTQASDADAVSAFASQWKQRGGTPAQALAPQLASLLASPKDTELVIRDIATRDGGTLDIVILATVHTQFANKMGARSVWFSANGVMQVYDAWTGRLIAEHTRDVQAVGLGDQAASAKAIVELMRALAGDAAGDVNAVTRGPSVSSASR